MYDLVSEAWTHDTDNPFTDLGGVGAIDHSDNLYITRADWTGGRQDKLHVVAPDGTLLNTYGVGPGAGHVTLAQVQSVGVATANVNHDGVVNILDLGARCKQLWTNRQKSPRRCQSGWNY